MQRFQHLDADPREEPVPASSSSKSETETEARTEAVLPAPPPARRPHGPTCVRVVPPSTFSQRDDETLATALSGLALSARTPIALELAAEGQRRSYLARAANPAALAHLVDQIQALYPQARIEEIGSEQDPLRRGRGEAVTVTELAIGGPAYLSLRTLDRKTWGKNEAGGSDPLLAVFGALHRPAPGCRVVVQLALRPAPPHWSHRFWRKAVEHPLDPERARERTRSQRATARVSGPSTGMLVALGLVIAVGLLVRFGSGGSRFAPFWQRITALLPAWVLPAVQHLLHGQIPRLAAWQIGQVALALGVLVALVVLVNRLVRLWHRDPLYDMKAVADKARQVAYRAKLRVLVIGPRVSAPDQPSRVILSSSQDRQERWGWAKDLRRGGRRLLVLLARGIEHLLAWCGRGFARGKRWLARHAPGKLPQVSFPRETRRALVRIARRMAAHPLAFRAERVLTRFRQGSGPVVAAVGQATGRAVLTGSRLPFAWFAAHRARRVQAARVVAAYRQYHQANGASFRPRVLRIGAGQLVPRAEGREGDACPTWQRVLRATLFPLRLPLWLLRVLLVGRADWTRGVASSGWYLSVAELAALWHLVPEQDAPDIAGLERARARTRPLPPFLFPDAPLADLIPYQVGTCTHAGQSWPVEVPRAVTGTSSLAVATSGKGKSTLFSHLALAHLAGNPAAGLFVMEPHGDMIAALLGCLPPGRREDVTLVDLADEQHVVGLNPLDMTQGVGRDKAVENILAVFAAIGRQQKNWGARMENIIRYGLLTLAEANLTRLAAGEDADAQFSLLDLVPLLLADTYRAHVLTSIQHDRTILDWWEDFYLKLRADFRSEIVAPVVNKLSAYAASAVSRRILGQSRATVRFREDIREGRVVLVSTASGVIGEELSALCGATLTGLFQAALAEQAALPVEDRRRFWVAVDEFQTYLGINYPHLLAELRKYGGSFGLATQSLAFLDQVDRALRPAVLANAEQLFTFAMSAEDARHLEPYVEVDDLAARDLLLLDSYTCYARLTVAGRRLPAFSLSLARPPQPDPAVAARAREEARARVTRPADVVDAELAGEHAGNERGGDETPHEDPAGQAGFAWRQNHQGPRPRETGKRRGKGGGKREERPLWNDPPGLPRTSRQAGPLPLSPQGEPLTGPVALGGRPGDTFAGKGQDQGRSPRSSAWDEEENEDEEEQAEEE